MYFRIMAGSSRNATERASSAASSSSQMVGPTQTTSSNQTADFTLSSSSLKLVSEFRKPYFIVFVNYEDDPHENNGEEEEEEEESDEEKEDKEGDKEASDREREKEKESDEEESDEDKEDKEINEENEEEINEEGEGEDGWEEEEEGGGEEGEEEGRGEEEEEESAKEAATGMWNIGPGRFEAEVNGRDIASLWEIKPFDDDLFFASPKALRKRVEFIMDRTLAQIQTQVQFAFTEFPHQDKISTFCIVGLYWRAMDFRRGQMPTLPKSKLSDPDYSAEKVDFIPCRTTAIPSSTDHKPIITPVQEELDLVKKISSFVSEIECYDNFPS
jgi:hypothetical protein